MQVEVENKDQEAEKWRRKGARQVYPSLYIQEVPSHCPLCRQHNLVHRERPPYVRLCNERVSEQSNNQLDRQRHGEQHKTAEKYLRIIKNALFLENEEEKRTMRLGGRGETVQADESCVFSKKTELAVFSN